MKGRNVTFNLESSKQLEDGSHLKTYRLKKII